jgi:hypothetical protein
MIWDKGDYYVFTLCVFIGAVYYIVNFDKYNNIPDADSLYYYKGFKKCVGDEHEWFFPPEPVLEKGLLVAEGVEVVITQRFKDQFNSVSIGPSPLPDSTIVTNKDYTPD